MSYLLISQRDQMTIFLKYSAIYSNEKLSNSKIFSTVESEFIQIYPNICPRLVKLRQSSTNCAKSGHSAVLTYLKQEHATENQIPVRIVCSEPRRLAAVSVADRVVSERNDTVNVCHITIKNNMK